MFVTGLLAPVVLFVWVFTLDAVGWLGGVFPPESPPQEVSTKIITKTCVREAKAAFVFNGNSKLAAGNSIIFPFDDARGYPRIP